VSAAADEKALRRCRSAIAERRPDDAERVARDVLSRNPQHAGALFLLGAALLMQQRAGEAVGPLEEAACIRADSVTETHLAMALRNSGQSAAALTWFERATTRQPAFAPAFKEFGATLRAMRRFAEAEAVLKRGQELAPPMPDLDILLGAVLLRRADLLNAKAAFARALAYAPDHPEALLGYGSALVHEGEFGSAAEQFRLILTRHPAHLHALRNLAHCLIELGRWDEGAACLRTAVEIDPNCRGDALRTLVASGRGRFWLKRSAAAEFLGIGDKH